jgi:hypothetical protein
MRRTVHRQLADCGTLAKTTGKINSFLSTFLACVAVLPAKLQIG